MARVRPISHATFRPGFGERASTMGKAQVRYWGENTFAVSQMATQAPRHAMANASARSARASEVDRARRKVTRAVAPTSKGVVRAARTFAVGPTKL